MSVKPKVETVYDIIGDWGRWQTNVALFGITAATFSAFNGMSSSFYAPIVPFHCANETSNFTCSTHDGSECQTFVYDMDPYGSTAVSEWDLVCDNLWLASFSQSVYMIGIVFSAIIFGWLSDKYGRKKVLLLAVVIEILGGTAGVYAPTMNLFIVTRFFLALGCYGRNLSGFLLAIESVGTKYRALMGIAVQLGWATGYCVLPGLAFYFKDFRKLMMATTYPEIALFLWLLLIPESPRWLMSKDKFTEAKQVMKKVMETNSMPMDLFEQDFEELKYNLEQNRKNQEQLEQQTFLDLWKNNLMVVYTLVFYFTWFTNAFVYYGISLNIGDLGGDLYWNFFWAGFIEFPSYFFCMWAFKYFGRRPLLIWFMIGSGISCLGIVPLSMMGITHHWSVTVFAMLGKFCITSSFGLIYVYSAEVYPTVLRQIGVGTCSVAGRAGSIIAPFIKELTMYTSYGVSMGIFGGLSLLTGLAAIRLPETKGKDIPDRIEDVHKLRDSYHSKDGDLGHTS